MWVKHGLILSFMGALHHVYAYCTIAFVICCIEWLLLCATDLSTRYTLEHGLGSIWLNFVGMRTEAHGADFGEVALINLLTSSW